MGESKAKTITSWILQVLLALLFLAAASGKLLGNPQIKEMFEVWGYSATFVLVIGVLELAGAVGLLIPRTAGLAALGLIGVMIGAAYTHLANAEGLQVLRPLIFMALLAGVVWLRRPWPFRGRSRPESA